MAEPPQDMNEDHLFKQYEIFVELADRVSERRINSTTTYYALINTLLVSSFAFLTVIKPDHSANGIVMIVIAIAGFLFTLSLSNTIKAFRIQNAARYRVIHQMESHFSFQPFESEWNELRQNSRRYGPMIDYEKIVSSGFILIYIFLLVSGIYSLFKTETTKVAITHIHSGADDLTLHNFDDKPWDLSGWLLKFQDDPRACLLSGSLYPGQDLYVKLSSTSQVPPSSFDCLFEKPPYSSKQSDSETILFDDKYQEVSKFKYP